MNQRNTTRTILAVIIATALVVSVGSLTALHTFPADATKPKHNDDDDNGNGNNIGDNVVNTLPQQPQLAPLSMETAANTGGNVQSDDVATMQQQAQPQQQEQLQAQQAAHPQTAACGQVVSGVVNLTANLNCRVEMVS